MSNNVIDYTHYSPSMMCYNNNVYLTLSCPEVLSWATDQRCRSVPY